MKAYQQNIIAVFLTLLYLITTMGFELVRHECRSCEEISYHLSSENAENGCSSMNVADSCCAENSCEHKQSHIDDTCCSLDTFLLQHSHETDMSQSVKIPTLSVIILFNHLSTIQKSIEPSALYADYFNYILDTSQPSLEEELCRFLC